MRFGNAKGMMVRIDFGVNRFAPMLGHNRRPEAPGEASEKLGTRRFICIVCGHIYDEALGDPETGLAPGTLWEDVPDSWRCPVCRLTKNDFEPFRF